jgi:hypothetical protein
MIKDYFLSDCEDEKKEYQYTFFKMNNGVKLCRLHPKEVSILIMQNSS